MKLSENDIILLAQNLKYLLIGVFAVLSILGVVLGFVSRYLFLRLKMLDKLADEVKLVLVRFDGVESFVKNLVDLNARVTLIEKTLDKIERGKK